MADLAPTVLWAQRSDVVYLTIDVQDCTNPKIKITDHQLTFTGDARSHATGAEKHHYYLHLELFDEVDEAESKVNEGARRILLVLKKKNTNAEHWPRLLKEKGKAPQNIKVDWDKWVDEDEEDEAPDPTAGMDFASMLGGGGMGGMGMGGMGGMGGMAGLMGGGGMGGLPPGMEGLDLSQFQGAAGDDDSDDDDLPGDAPPA